MFRLPLLNIDYLSDSCKGPFIIGYCSLYLIKAWRLIVLHDSIRSGQFIGIAHFLGVPYHLNLSILQPNDLATHLLDLSDIMRNE